MDEPDDTTPLVSGTEAEINQLLGLFDSPAFVRRGHDLEYALARLRQRLARERDGMLDMVRLRLRQWCSVATGPGDHADVFDEPVVPLWALAHPSTEPAAFADRPGPTRRRKAVGRDLAASVTRFNRRWGQFLGRLTLDNLNQQVEHYNRYYVLEKECVLGSARLAARHFEPKPKLTFDLLLAEHPLLPAPGLVFP